jgi:tetratricopeptide (TPR) repeat protein
MTARTDFQAELDRIDADIAELGPGAFAAPLSAERVTKLVYRRYQRASLTGNLAALDEVEAAVDEAIAGLGPAPDLCLLKANLDLTLHRLVETRRDLEAGPGLRESVEGRTLAADLDLQEGRYLAAEEGYARIVAEHRTWDALARLAHLTAQMGDIDRAEQLYADAEDELTAKQMRSYAWVELQRGLLDLTHGRPHEAREHYRCAERAYSGYWLVDEHVAEWLGAQGKLAEAAALYAQVVARAPRPELRQALGELYVLLGESEPARACHETALAAYLQSARRGDVHYYHHLVDFYSDVAEDGPEAVHWARKDLALRNNFATQAALAWALYRDGRLEPATATIEVALASGVQDARLFARAAAIHQATGRTGEADRYTEMAARINPWHESFHSHH